MDVPEIRDRENLEAWLKTRSQQECVVIAHRAAMRVAPLWMDRVEFKLSSRRRTLTDIVFFRLLLISGVAFIGSAPKNKTAAAAARAAAAAAAATAIYMYFDAAAAVTSAASSADTAASSSAEAAAVYAAISTTDAASAAITADAARAISVATIAFWDVVWHDLFESQQGQYSLALPLWHDLANPLTDDWTRARAALIVRGADWDFWVRWYDAALIGKPLNWKVQEEIALLPSEVWEGDVSALAAAIAAIELKYALDATYNGEIIAINPVTGKLYLAPDTDLPADIATYANRKLRKAIDLFGDSPANQYTALGPELKLLADTLADASNLPVEIFDACASVSRRVIARAENGECPLPETDALVADFLTRVRDVGADIFGNDKATQKILQKRHGVRGNSTFVEARAIVLAGAELIKNSSSGYLATAIVINAEEATDTAIILEDRELASIKLAGRVSRVIGALSKIGAGLIASEKGVEAIDNLRASPTANQLFKLALKYLDF